MINLGGSVSTLTPQMEVNVFAHPSEDFKAAPVICYESIYGEFMGNYVHKGANFFAIITNDSWWKRTQGHKQLLSYARLRAVEHRRSIARSANSGISAFINQKGDILSRLDYETKGALEETIQDDLVPVLICVRPVQDECRVCFEPSDVTSGAVPRNQGEPTG